MADRTVTVRLRTNYDSTGVRRASSDYESFARKVEARNTRINKGLKTVSTGLLGVGVVAAAGVGEAIKAFASFDAKMSTTGALAHATASDMQSLRHAALTVGRDFGISANQAADAEQELVKAGISVRDILGGGLKGALTLAAAGQIDVGHAAEIATEAMTQFNLAGRDMPHVADLLAAGADKALGGVGELGDGLSQVGTTAAQMNLTIEDTVGVLAEFANAGLIGERGGTTFKQFLLQLAAPTEKAAGLMKQYGLSIYDANGQMKSMPEIAGNLQKAFKDLTPAQRNSALATIFGSRAVQAANILYREGAKGTQAWIDKVDASGFAAHQASAKLNNLEGDLQKLKVAFNTAFIQAGSGGNEFARGLVQNLTKVIDKFDDLSPAQQKLTLEIAAGVAAVGLLGGGMLRLVVSANEARVALAGMIKASGGLKAVAGNLGGLTLGVGLGVGAFELTRLIGKATVAQESTSALAKSFKQLGSQANLGAAGLRLLSNDMDPFTGQTQNAGEALNRFGQQAASSQNSVRNLAFGLTGIGTVFESIQFGQFTNQAKQADAALAQLVKGGYVYEAKNSFDAMARSAEANGVSVSKLKSYFPQYEAALSQATGAADAHAQAEQTVSRAMAGAKVSATELKNALDKLANDQQSVESANLAFRDSLAAARQALKANGKTLDENTAKGRANRAALLASAEQATALSNAVYQATGSQEKANNVLAAARTGLVALAVRFGLTKKEADRYVTSVLGIPPVKKTDIKENAREAKKHVDALKQAIDGIHDKNIHIRTFASKAVINSYAKALAGVHSKTVTITTVHSGRKGDIGDLLNPTPWRGGLVARYRPTVRLAMGGFAGQVSGPGGPTDDAAGLFALSNEEYVTRAWATNQMRSRYGDGVMDYMNTYGRFPGLAGGGQPVQGSRFASTP